MFKKTGDGSLSCSTELQKLERNVRNSYIKELRKVGLSTRQISRLTGISKSVVGSVSKYQNDTITSLKSEYDGILFHWIETENRPLSLNFPGKFKSSLRRDHCNKFVDHLCGSDRALYDLYQLRYGS